MQALSFLALTALILALAAVNWVLKAPRGRISPLLRGGVLASGALVAALSTWFLVVNAASGFL
ncbi:hypothetical protein QOZ88_10905 [Blastococcus sp. BMG 814]|uniref:Uncharacterized protein n=1 Tax=Blastococcus carthaginiensis TaxID=3050034 RepID=A0ABT9IC59_9ACTN|nr:hypothetical protein [Blastococcus carthaginiensis]MDP5183148.1 hypothetical protein [Blastococcus carthaginiensis]